MAPSNRSKDNQLKLHIPAPCFIKWLKHKTFEKSRWPFQANQPNQLYLFWHENLMLRQLSILIGEIIFQFYFLLLEEVFGPLANNHFMSGRSIQIFRQQNIKIHLLFYILLRGMVQQFQKHQKQNKHSACYQLILDYNLKI